MDKDELPDAAEPLDDSQRIELLENARKLDRLLLMALGGVLLVIIASWLTYAALLLSSDEESASMQAVSSLQERVASLDRQVVELKEQLASQQATAAQGASPRVTAGTDNPAVTQQVAKTLIGQERNFQQSLAALKQGMRDLAGMIPGSRSWLTFYHEALDTPLGESRTRMKELEGWVESLPAAEPAPSPAPATAPTAPASPKAAGG